MSHKKTNPYKRGNYHDLFSFIQSKRIVTISQVIDEAVKLVTAKGKKVILRAIQGSVTVLLSPRESSTRGDCRGNISAMGHIYYMEKLARKMVDGNKEEQRFRLRFRGTPLEPRTREAKKVEAKKVKADVVTQPQTQTQTKTQTKKSKAKKQEKVSA